MANTIAIEGFLSQVYSEEYTVYESIVLSNELEDACEAIDFKAAGNKAMTGIKNIGEMIRKLIAKIGTMLSDLVAKVVDFVNKIRTRKGKTIKTNQSYADSFKAFEKKATELMASVSSSYEGSSKIAATALSAVEAMSGDRTNINAESLRSELENIQANTENVKTKVDELNSWNLTLNEGVNKENATVEINTEAILKIAVDCSKIAKDMSKQIRPLMSKTDSMLRKVSSGKNVDEGLRDTMQAAATAVREANSNVVALSRVGMKIRSVVVQVMGGRDTMGEYDKKREASQNAYAAQQTKNQTKEAEARAKAAAKSDKAAHKRGAQDQRAADRAARAQARKDAAAARKAEREAAKA